MIVQHSSATNEHPTPEDVVEKARALLRVFDLDPASCAEFNERVKAKRFFSIDDDGLAQKWEGRVFLNPPGGKLKLVNGVWVPVPKGPGKSSMMVWWDKLAQGYVDGSVTSAFFVGFTLEILRTSQACCLPIQAFPRCYPKDRLHFKGDSPGHANVLVYLPPKTIDPELAINWFRRNFGDIGLCEAGDRTLIR